MSLADLVNVSVSLSAAGLTAPGFGTMAILSYKPAWAERSRTYNKLTDVAVDFLTTDPEYVAAAKAFSATPNAPSQIKVIRAALKPTVVEQVAVVAVGANVYKINIFDIGVVQSVSHTAPVAAAWVINTPYLKGAIVVNDTTPLKFYICTVAGTSAGSGGPTGTGAAIVDNSVTWMYAGTGVLATASNDAILFNLMTLINALAAPALDCTATLTGSAAAKILTVTGNAAGNYFALEVASRAMLSVANTTADPGTATDLDAILNYDSDWYGLETLVQSTAIILAAAAWAEPARKLYQTVSHDTPAVSIADGSANDVIHVLKGLSYAHVACAYHPRAWEFFDAARYGRFLPTTPGAATWRMKSLVGVSPETYTPTEQTNLKAKNADWYDTVGSAISAVSVVEGAAKTVGGVAFIDTTIGIDWIIAQIQVNGFNLLYANDKVPQTDGGIALIKSMMLAVFKLGIQNNLIAASPVPVVNVPLASALTPTDRAARNIPNITGACTFSGAVHSLAAAITVTQ